MTSIILDGEIVSKFACQSRPRMLNIRMFPTQIFLYITFNKASTVCTNDP